jgi:hypothetical protein
MAEPFAPEPASKVLAEFQSPTPHGLIGDQDPALEDHFLDEAQAQRKMEIKPNGKGDDLGREAVSLIAQGRQGHEARPTRQSIPNPLT